MGQRNELEMTLAAIRRRKSVYKKNLENLEGLSAEMKQQLDENIQILNEEERKILEQMDVY